MSGIDVVLTMLCAVLTATNIYTLKQLYDADMKNIQLSYDLRKNLYEGIFKAVFRRK